MYSLMTPAYILHTRPWRETSLLLTAFSRDHGRVELVARGARARTSARRGLIHLFQPLLLSWSGNGSLLTLHNIEEAEAYRLYSPKAQCCGLYLNEMLWRALPEWDPAAAVYDYYGRALKELLQPDCDWPATLRLFELDLLCALGYEPPLQSQPKGLDPSTVSVDRTYHYVPGHGPQTSPGPGSIAVKGETLLALARRERIDDGNSEARNLLQSLLRTHLELDRMNNSRQFFAALFR